MTGRVKHHQPKAVAKVRTASSLPANSTATWSTTGAMAALRSGTQTVDQRWTITGSRFFSTCFAHSRPSTSGAMSAGAQGQVKQAPRLMLPAFEGFLGRNESSPVPTRSTLDARHRTPFSRANFANRTDCRLFPGAPVHLGAPQLGGTAVSMTGKRQLRRCWEPYADSRRAVCCLRVSPDAGVGGYVPTIETVHGVQRNRVSSALDCTEQTYDEPAASRSTISRLYAFDCC